MRRLGAESLRNICRLDLWNLASDCVARVVCDLTILDIINSNADCLTRAASAKTPLLSFSDTSDVHGALLALIELATAYEAAEPKNEAEAKRREVSTLLRFDISLLMNL